MGKAVLTLGCFVYLFVGEVAGKALIGRGFCIERSQLRGPFDGTGYAGLSPVTNKTLCEEKKSFWCPLLNATDVWNYKPGQLPLQYYYFSACCTGRSRKLLKEVNGLPTCRDGVNPKKCAYHDWALKLSDDLVGSQSMYDVSISPGTPWDLVDWTQHDCICSPDHPDCIKKNEDGTVCLVCQTTKSCGPDTVQMGFQLFKVLNADVRTSELSVSVWLKQQWYDRRLSFHKQCYGSIDTIPMQVKSGSQSESRIWTPDIELLNYKVPIWGGFVERLAQVHSCRDPKPNFEGCGYVTMSAPGVLTALCKFKGLAAFPYDILSCEMELAAWSTDGFAQDIMPRRQDGGISWVDDPTNANSGGAVAGSSYQDYTLSAISLRRIVTQFDCCVGQPWPGLIYEFSFRRSSTWYEFKLVVPMVMLTVMSFLSYWIHPKFAERLSFAAIVLLALLTHDIVVSAFLPICTERTFMGYLSFISQCFAEFAVLETGIVLWVYNQKVDSWWKALVPRPLRRLYIRKRLPSEIPDEIIKRDEARLNLKTGVVYQEGKEAQIRDQCYKRLFQQLDRNYLGFLEPEDLIFFGSFLTGSRFRNIEDLAFVRRDPTSDYINYEDFVTFCETKIECIDDTGYLVMSTENFCDVAEKREELLQESWEDTAVFIDSWARWSVPFSFFCFFVTLYDTSYVALVENRFSIARQVLMLLTPIWPMIVVGGVCLAVSLHRARHMRNIKKLSGGDAIDQGTAWYRSYSIEQSGVHRRDIPEPEDSPLLQRILEEPEERSQKKKNVKTKAKSAQLVNDGAVDF